MKYPMPYGNRVLVRLNKIMAGKIIVSDANAKTKGEVVQVSETANLPTPPIGCQIMFADFLKKEIEVEGDKENKYLLVEIEGIQAIL